MSEVVLRCPKCGRALELNYGRHGNKWWISHPGIALWSSPVSCPDQGKKWMHCATEELAIAAFQANDSNWSPPTAKTIALMDRLIDAEIGKAERDRRKGYMRG